MDRRIVLTGLVALAASPALSQQSGGASSSSMSSGGSANQADMQHMQQTMMLGMMSLETSKLALEKARNDDLKQFARFETNEQTTLAEIHKSMMEPTSTSATGSSASSSGTSMQMDAKGREMVQKLSKASGAEFDREYLQGQLEGHKELLQVQEKYLSGNPGSREHVNIAKLSRNQIREHIALLEDIQKKMR